jgi:alkaline phosphatase D
MILFLQRSVTHLLFILISVAAEAQLESGPIVGHTTATSAVLWAYDSDLHQFKVECWEAHTDNPTVIHEHMIRESDARSPIFLASLEGLKPNTAYRYRVVAQNRQPVEGGFTTAPESGKPAKFSYVVTSCIDAIGSPEQPAWDEVLVHRPSFNLMLGDNVYANTTDYHRLVEAHIRQRAIPNFAALIASTPTYATWDDHDFGPNDSHAQTPGKENSLEAFKDMFANPAAGTDDTPGVFYSFNWADLEFFVLDNRYYRTDEHADVPNKTQFGEAQLAWLAEGLSTSDATFKIVATGYDVMGSRYPDEIKQIASIIRESKAAGVFFHAGDIHRNEFKQQNHGAGYPITQITSSGIARRPNRPWAMIDVDTTADDPVIIARFFECETLVTTHTLRLSDLTDAD